RARTRSSTAAACTNSSDFRTRATHARARRPIEEMSDRFATPPRARRPDHALRRVGLEVEFAGPTLDAAARVVCELYGGVVERKNRFASIVRGTHFGDFAVEIDSKV